MKKRFCKAAAGVLSLGLVLGMVTGCGGSSVDASRYLNALLGVAYCSDAVDDVALDMDEKEREAAMESSVEKEAEFLARYFGMEDVSEKSEKAFEEIAWKISMAAQYEVEEAKGDAVVVRISPFQVRTEELQEFVDKFAVQKYVDGDEACTEEKFVSGVTGILEKTLKEPAYGDPVEVSVTVSKKDGAYQISDEDLAAIDEAMFVY